MSLAKTATKMVKVLNQKTKHGNEEGCNDRIKMIYKLCQKSNTVPVHIMKAYGGVEVQVHTFLAHSTSRKSMVTFKPAASSPLEK